MNYATDLPCVVTDMLSWGGEEIVSPAIANVSSLFTWLGVGIAPSVLVTINAIAVALMILAVGVPATAADPVTKLQGGRRRFTERGNIARVALFEAVMFAGSAGLISTILLTLHRPTVRCDAGGDGCGSAVLTLATDLTTIAMMVSTCFFLFRIWHLSDQAPHADDSRNGSGFLPTP